MLSLPALLNHLFACELNHLEGFHQERRKKALLLCVSTGTLGMSDNPPEPMRAQLHHHHLKLKKVHLSLSKSVCCFQE